MKYLCLVYSEEKILNEMANDETDRFIDEHLVLRKELESSGHSIAAEALQSVQTATTIRVRNSKISITDGPFAETKEQLTGFYFVHARDLNEAMQIAAKIPAARIGSVEVRPIRDLVAEHEGSGRKI
jgi:hypothetical protein